MGTTQALGTFRMGLTSGSAWAGLNLELIGSPILQQLAWRLGPWGLACTKDSLKPEIMSHSITQGLQGHSGYWVCGGFSDAGVCQDPGFIRTSLRLGHSDWLGTWVLWKPSFVGVEYKFAVASLAWDKMWTWGCGIEPTAGIGQKLWSTVDDWH